MPPLSDLTYKKRIYLTLSFSSFNRRETEDKKRKDSMKGDSF